LRVISSIKGSITIRQAVPEDATGLRELRLEALKNHPKAFGSDYDSEVNHPLSFWESRLANSLSGAVYLAVHQMDFIGMAGIYRSERVKLKHTANIWGVYLQPAFRGHNIADQLVLACLEWAKEQAVRRVKLAVITTNIPAINLYIKCGFCVYGVDPQVIQWQGLAYDELLMSCPV
jgi:ribosomal protein S18 acetylase RimI-like enzyme